MEWEGQYQLFGYCHMRKCIRQFVPGRIRSIELTDNFFIRDESFDVNSYLADSMAVIRGDPSRKQTVLLRFTGMAVGYARERLWHPGQRLEPAKDGISS